MSLFARCICWPYGPIKRNCPACNPFPSASVYRVTKQAEKVLAETMRLRQTVLNVLEILNRPTSEEQKT